MHLFANNLYGWAINQPLPIGGYWWVNPRSLILDEVLATPYVLEGYLLEVDLEYPKHLHNSHSDYPLAPETLCVPEAWISNYNYQRALLNELGG